MAALDAEVLRLAAIGSYVVENIAEILDGLDEAVQYFADGAHEMPRPDCTDECDFCGDARRVAAWQGHWRRLGELTSKPHQDR